MSVYKVDTQKKKDLLLLHGYLSNGKSFYYQTEYFKQYFNVYAPDLKGFGENTDMKFPYSLSDYALEVEKYIKENGLNKPHVIAHSFGGRIALYLSIRNNDVFDKMVLTGCAGLKPKRKPVYYLKKGAFNLCKLVLDKEKLQKFYSSDYRALPPVMKKSFIKIVNENLDKGVKYVDNDTLLIFGENDKETPLYMAEKLNREIKKSKLSVYNNAGHFAFIDMPDKFNTEVREFLLS